jgi:hypothetical protein
MSMAQGQSRSNRLADFFYVRSWRPITSFASYWTELDSSAERLFDPSHRSFLASRARSVASRIGFGIRKLPNQLEATAPHWLLITIAAMFGVGSWWGWRLQFSLRTLLIATTLIAVVLGLVAALNC